jgi:asparagine synthase (glutamine-hydrolysing)
MCGICGIIRFDDLTVDETVIKNMMAQMKYRGPDDEGCFVENNIGLGHVRLSILDLSEAGHQPMFSDDDRYVLVFNGEIYNYLELKEELSQDFKFKSSTDSEVLLKAYIKWGKGCLDKFNGMFAFAIYDKYNGTLFCARDRFGIKPYYYYLDKNFFAFASDIPPLMKVLANRAADKQMVYDYLAFDRICHIEDSFFEGVKKLQHGHYLELKDKKIQTSRWYNLPNSLKEPFNGIEDLKASFEESIKVRLRSDVPVGACLSGGLDSSAIVSTMLKTFDFKNLNTFSAVYEKGMRGDETPFIMEYRDTVENMFFTSPTADGLYADMDRFIAANSEPVTDTSVYAEFKVMESAQHRVTVLLSGQGADEEMAGYHYFFGMLYKEMFLKLQWMKMTKEILAYLHRHRSLLGLYAFGYFMLPGNLKNIISTRYKKYLNQDFKHEFKGSNAIVEQLYGASSLHKSLLRHFEYKLEHLLIWVDRNSMWFSLESRFPFLDHRFVERVFTLENKDIINNGETKCLFREAMKGVIPERLRKRQDKVGFETPADRWFRLPQYKNLIEDILNSKSFAEMGFIDAGIAGKLYRKHLKGEINISNDIWKWINLYKWSEKYLS